MMESLKIPEERKGVLIGKEGKVKSRIEGSTGTEISVDQDVEIRGQPLDVLKAKNIVKAIGRGFPPSKAMKLRDENRRLVVITLSEETKKGMKRIFSRIIGRNGRCRKKIENFTKTDLCVYGKTISIIGNWDDAEDAAEIVDLLISGKPHSYVYRRLEELK